MTVEYQSQKQVLREVLKQSRANIDETRRMDALQRALAHLSPVFHKYPLVLSYSSFGDELCTKMINQQLLKEGKLALPRVNGEEMKVFSVSDMDRELTSNRWGILEPDPQFCQEISISEISLVLVPAIGFDKNNHRVGYGGGYYDRFLSRLSPEVTLLGVGYKEQFVRDTIPSESTDVSLSEVFLY